MLVSGPRVLIQQLPPVPNHLPKLGRARVAATKVPYPRRQDVPNNAPRFEDPIGSCSLNALG